jgi:hypothetical protein
VCVVAHLPEGVEADHVTEELVRRLFLVRQRFWPDGSAAHPVNLPAASPVRDRFSRAIFGETVQEMVPYWNDRYFHGTRPPPTVASEAAVLLYLDRTSGGIGYVQASAAEALPTSVTRLFCTSPGVAGSDGTARRQPSSRP